jgi:HAD superfamily hydrolase (TIGR01456 family)
MITRVSIPLIKRCCTRAFSSSGLGFVFDIDGVLLRGKTPLPHARASLERLNAARVPWILLTNGGGETEAAKAAALTKLLGVTIDERQVILSHTPMKSLCTSLGAAKVLVLGCRDVPSVARAYGLSNALTATDVLADDPHSYPFLPAPPLVRFSAPLRAAPWKAVLVLHDPNNWGLEVQVAIDVLRGGEAGTSQTVPMYCSNGDLTFAGAHAVPRLAAGAFSVALKATWAATMGEGVAPLHSTFFGKPEKAQFHFAESHLREWAGGNREKKFNQIVMVGDNPAADIRGANSAGTPWTSVLVRTGLWKGANDSKDKAALVVDGVQDAVHAFLPR